MIQVIGTKKCKDTAKALRFFKEYKIEVQFRDLNVKLLSEGELKKITQKIKPQDLINENSSAYKNKGLAYMEFDPLEEISENNFLLITPILRNGSDVSVGVNLSIWKSWIKK